MTNDEIVERYAAKLKSEGAAGSEITRRTRLIQTERPLMESDYWNRFHTDSKSSFNKALIALGFSEETKERLMLIRDQSGAEQLILGAGAKQASEIDGNVTQLCKTIVHLLTSRYSITYHTSILESASARHIEVLVPGHDYQVLARRSYVTPR